MNQEKFLGGITFHQQIKVILFQNGQKIGTYSFIFMDKLAGTLKISLLKIIFKNKMLFCLVLVQSF
jgi:hypothetical protein